MEANIKITGKEKSLLNSESFRVYVKKYGKEGIGRVIVVKSGWNFDTLLLKLSEKFEMRVTDLYLQREGEDVRKRTYLTF
jgi:hypothetical protein